MPVVIPRHASWEWFVNDRPFNDPGLARLPNGHVLTRFSAQTSAGRFYALQPPVQVFSQVSRAAGPVFKYTSGAAIPSFSCRRALHHSVSELALGQKNLHFTQDFSCDKR